jgi:hypothetical protein
MFLPDCSGDSIGSRVLPLVSMPIEPDSDESIPPALIDIIAENYKYRLTSRSSDFVPEQPPPRKLVPILIIEPHQRQCDRAAHFLPQPGDSVPRHAQIFDIEAATFEYNEKIFERQQMSLARSARLCNPPPKPRRPGTAQRAGTPRIGYEKQSPRQPGRTLPVRQVAMKKPQLPPEAVSDCLAGSLKISRVTMGPTAKRPTSTKPVVKGEIRPRKSKPDARRYQSPPPRASRVKRSHNSLGGSENEPQYEREEK